MFKSLLRYIRAVGYLVTFRVDKARESLSMNPGVMAAGYDDVIDKEEARVAMFKDALASMVAIHEGLILEAKGMESRILKLLSMRDGAIAAAKSATGSEYEKHKSAFVRFDMEAKELDAKLAELIGRRDRQGMLVESNKEKLRSLVSSLKRLREEKDSAVASVQVAAHEREISDALAGIASDDNSKQLAELRSLRAKVEAGAKVSSELAGVGVVEDAIYESGAARSASEDAFDALLRSSEVSDSQKSGPVAIPEE